ncbi:ATP-binding cassette sub-family C member 5-like isoform X2 [Antedon mediterranea]|uniref:ATP-binding cassette sub-family C member 5-like isoform X2 n=1 Tax=Antedon mediterranea TaxID=105859 RepID=UPI003AF88629
MTDIDYEAVTSGDDNNSPESLRPRSNSYDSYSEAVHRQMEVVFAKHKRVYNQLHKHEKKPNPLDSVGYLSILTYSWCTKFFSKAAKRPLDVNDLFACSQSDSAKENAERFEKLWQEELAKHGPENASVATVFQRFLWRPIIISIAVLVITLGSWFAEASVVVRKLLEYSEQPVADLQYGIILVVILFICQLITCLGFALEFYLNTRWGMRLRTAIVHAVYRKIMRIRNLNGKTAGEIMNLCTSDGQRVLDMVLFLPFLFVGPVLAISGWIYTGILIGPSAILGTGVFFLFFPLQMVIFKIVSSLRESAVSITDARVSKMDEIISNIKVIKMYAWELPFINKIAKVRLNEKVFLEKAAIIQSINLSLSPLVPIIATVVTILVHTLLGDSLTAAQAFTYVACLNSMRVTLMSTPYAIKGVGEASVAAKRIKEILLLEDIEEKNKKPEDQKHAITISKAIFCWNKDAFPSGISEVNGDQCIDEKGKNKINNKPNQETDSKKDDYTNRKELMIKDSIADHTEMCQPFLKIRSKENLMETLFDVDLVIEKGSLVGVCGSVGTGKSSLLSAILNHMICTKGEIATDGSFAYAAQQSWIMNATVRDNILFGKAFDEERYKKALFACCLLEDLKNLSNGDQTMIGERGMNLSGGQKQRISLARALYADHDIYLLDDPLSSVDVHVGQHLFTHLIMQELKNKTVVFVTHQLQYLSHCDKIILMKSGRISETGCHQELIALDGDYADLMRSYNSKQKNNNNLSQQRLTHEQLQKFESMKNGIKIAEEERQPIEGEKLVEEEEEKSEGRIDAKTYHQYTQAAGGYVILVVVLVTFAVTIGCAVFNNWWLSHWLSQGSGDFVPENVTMKSMMITDNPEISFYQTVYGMTVVVYILFTILRSTFFAKVTLQASSKLHDSMFGKVIVATMSFFETTPSGRILNRFSKDMDELDVRLPFNMDLFLQQTMLIILSLFTVAKVFPYFLIAVVIMVVIFGVLINLFRHGFREAKQLDNILRSPWITHISTTVPGLPTIQAYNKTKHYEKQFELLLDNHSVAMLLFNMASRWLGLRLDFVSTLMATFTGILVVLFHGSVSAAYSGLALSYSLQMMAIFQFAVRLTAEVEARFTSVERVIKYIEDVPTEEIEYSKEKNNEWPVNGEVHFKDVCLRYRPNLPQVLNQITFNTRPKEKVGIVGRTGSGKSSLGVALFRLVDTETGCILIDNKDIRNISLFDLRSKMSIIPQDPVLFAGTLRTKNKKLLCTNPVSCVTIGPRTKSYYVQTLYPVSP